MSKALYANIETEILALKKERNAVILAHNYQIGEVQDIADFVGDSLGLSQQAAKTDAEVIVFCGVHFMAETASILCPQKTVLIPDLGAGCSLAEMVNPEAVIEWKKSHPNGVVVAYVNTSAAVKAESDYCCTSSNAVKVVESIPKDKEILFIPDFFLGHYVQQMTGRKMDLWQGFCTVHVRIREEEINALRIAHPDAVFLIHPECGCSTSLLKKDDVVASTEGILKYCSQSNAKEFIIATENGILHRLQKDYPDKKFYPAATNAICEYMKQITLENLADALDNMQYEVKVPKDIADRARIPIERMLEIS
ncbi:MAG: quinolinate synthase NadA [Chlamydiota bacterium]|nr:quinolinate synthase NadA [Chlamydiota bacterium]